MTTTRPAAVAGAFYPAEPQALRSALAGYLASADTVEAALGSHAAQPPKMLVVPHAGYIYSGKVAALAYAPLARWRGRITRVVLLGPVHRLAVRALAAPSVSAFETPLGQIALDSTALEAIGDLQQVVRTDVPHALEHSLEVQLPFLQSVLGTHFKLVPLAVGNASPSEVAEVLERLWGGDETVIVISSDLSHFLPYAKAKVRDTATVQRILNLTADLQGEDACGAAPLNGALLVAKHHQLKPRLLGLCNSGDTEGDANRVVGYCAIAFAPEPPAKYAPGTNENDVQLGRALVNAARTTIAQALDLGTTQSIAAHTDHPAMHQPGATFVTLHDAKGQLRGCIGRLEAYRSLGDDVRANAYAAAFSDPRFAPAECQGVARYCRRGFPA